MDFLSLAVGALALFSGAIARTIGSCPSGARQIQYDDGNVYEICPGTTFTGSTFSSASGCLSTWDCLQQCNLDPRCRRSIYRDSDRSCQFMANNTVWKTDKKFDSVHFVKYIPKTPATNMGLGQWSSVMITPVIPVGAYIVPQYPSSSKVMFFSSWGPTDFTSASAAGITQFADYNIVNGSMSTRTITNTHHDMFCPGMSYLQDGRLMVTGGNDADAVSLYDPVADNFISGPGMNIPRGYHTSAITSKGQVFVLGGSFTGGVGHKDGELFDPPTNTWNLLPGVPVDPCVTTDQSDGRKDNHMWLLGWKNGSVFHAGPSMNQHWIDTNGDGRIVDAGTRDPNSNAMCGIHVMYDAVAGKIYSAGGSYNYDDSDAVTTAHVTTIGEPYKPSQVQRVADLIHPRGFSNAVVLPDGKVLITGGIPHPIVFSDDNAWFAPELWDPKTGATTAMASAAIPRNYHSISLLLADGRVLTGGGGLCDTPYGESDARCGRTTDHPDIEIYSPPYLFDAANKPAVRPTISSVVASTDKTGRTVAVGGKLTVVISNPDTPTFALVRMGSVTHSVNTDQRRIPLSSVTRKGNTFTIQLPKDAGIMLPGFYYLFALSAAGTPSVANTIRVVLK